MQFSRLLVRSHGHAGLKPRGKHIVLLVPGLEGPQSDHPVADYLDQRPASIDRLVSRSQPEVFPGTCVENVLFRYFGLDSDTAVAPLTFAHDTGSLPSGYVMRVDPVHLHADQSSLRLFEAHSFTITQEEADALAASFNEYYATQAGQGRRIRTPVPHRWYLELDEAPAITMTPLADVAGMDINRSLPQGGEARSWHTLLNEVQMLFHEHAVNRAREQRGQPAINSLWPWGGGMLPKAGVNTEVGRVVAKNPLAVSLAMIAGIETGDMAESAEQLLPQVNDGVTLAVLDSLHWPARYNEVEVWVDALRILDEKMIAPLLDAIAGGTVSTLRLHPCNGTSFTLSRNRLRRFWRRIHPYERVLS